jgi:hypothetical protein
MEATDGPGGVCALNTGMAVYAQLYCTVPFRHTLNIKNQVSR